MQRNAHHPCPLAKPGTQSERQTGRRGITHPKGAAKPCCSPAVLGETWGYRPGWAKPSPRRARGAGPLAREIETLQGIALHFNVSAWCRRLDAADCRPCERDRHRMAGTMRPGALRRIEPDPWREARRGSPASGLSDRFRTTTKRRGRYGTLDECAETLCHHGFSRPL